jgi:hypothetical protein
VTLGQFLEALRRAPYDITITRNADGSVFIECDHGYRDRWWTTIAGPIADNDALDPEVARAACRELGISPGILGV